ncbi:MAG: hypothetical protein ACJ8C4_01165 [Gemmataceae bacterium]
MSAVSHGPHLLALRAHKLDAIATHTFAEAQLYRGPEVGSEDVPSLKTTTPWPPCGI